MGSLAGLEMGDDRDRVLRCCDNRLHITSQTRNSYVADQLRCSATVNSYVS